MKSKLLYWTLILLLSLGVTILIQALFREYRLRHLSHLNYVGIIEFLFTAIVLPIYLTALYLVLNRKLQGVGHFGFYALLTVICIIISSRLDFINWWDTEGKIINVTDAEARDVIELGLILQLIISVIVDIVSLITGRSLRKNNIKGSI
jgi:hypothetical protein